MRQVADSNDEENGLLNGRVPHETFYDKLLKKNTYDKQISDNFP